MDDYILQAEETADLIAQSYYKASKKIETEMAAVVKGLGAISNDRTALKYLKNPPSKSVVNTLKSVVNRMPEGPEKQEALTMISSPAYLFRMRRLQSVIDNARKECEKLYNVELTETTGHLRTLYNSAFSHTMYDIDQGYNTLHTFSLFPASRVETLLKSEWSGENYSSRIWSNTQALSQSLQEQLLISFMTGASVSKTARSIMGEFQSSAYAARRLVRTETNYIANQAEQDAYKRLGIEQYQYIATLDTRTSNVCRELDGKVFKVDEGKAGVNMPPMHPNCRSTTIMYDADFPIKSRAARDEEGNLINVPGNMTYQHWIDKYHPELDASEFVSRLINTVSGSGYKNLVNAFKSKLPSIRNQTVRKMLTDALGDVEIKKSPDERSYYDKNENIIYLANKSPVSTLAHELFHKIDNEHGISSSKTIENALEKDYKKLLERAKNSGLSLKEMLYSNYKDAFEREGIMKEKYRGVSDIIGAMTENEVNFGYTHKKEEWKKTKRKSKEAFAQFGRAYFQDDDEVFNLMRELFPETNKVIDDYISIFERYGA